MTGKTYRDNGYGIPVLTYEEMAGQVLGMDPWELGLQLHQVLAESLLDKMGIGYDPSMKQKGYLNENIGIPDKPGYLKTF